MTYKINGTDLTLKPTTGKWVERKDYGYDMTGHPVYPAVRQFELSWDLMPIGDFNQLYNFYQSIRASGTVAVSLPSISASSYQFTTYSGATLREPEVGVYYEEHVEDVRLLIANIRTA